MAAPVRPWLASPLLHRRRLLAVRTVDVQLAILCEQAPKLAEHGDIDVAAQGTPRIYGTYDIPSPYQLIPRLPPYLVAKRRSRAGVHEVQSQARPPRYRPYIRGMILRAYAAVRMTSPAFGQIPDNSPKGSSSSEVGPSEAAMYQIVHAGAIKSFCRHPLDRIDGALEVVDHAECSRGSVQLSGVQGCLGASPCGALRASGQYWEVMKSSPNQDAAPSHPSKTPPQGLQ
ncbi:hypothetical protein K432DRAFT_440040 [Lepidopterella palustris CBS 459.81]|uniref:Uncharacterized protein n=1 Tax=Lepidopterella palustris CBS 459.81 TaxID=1314670 RepID=A0A8E2EJ53_9PEZI|nr:hypothetical protein K432DRAFT_440040 [Lepidopterella palustris CBS 459.81]